MVRSCSSLFFIISLFLAVLGCDEVKTRNLESDSDVLEHSELSTLKVLEAWGRTNSNQETLFGELAIIDGTPEIPDSIASSMGLSSDKNAVQDLGFYNKAIFDPGQSSSGDLVLIQPAFLNYGELSPSTTGLYIFLRESFKRSAVLNLQVSRSQWDRMMILLGAYCNDCRFKKAAEVISVLRSRSDLRSDLESILSETNEGLLFFPSDMKNWGIYFYDYSKRLENRSASLDPIVETDSLNLFAYFVHPSDMTKNLSVSEWTKIEAGSEVAKYNGKTIEILTNFDDSGSYVFQGSYSGIEADPVSITYNVIVGNTNRKPLLVTVPEFSLQENHEAKLNLFPLAADPDGNANLVIRLDQAPPGCLLINGELIWNPLTTQLGSAEIKVWVEDGEGLASQLYTIKSNVIADNYPTFATVPNPFIVIEGIEGQITLNGLDPDGDLLVINDVDTFFSDILTSHPTGAGWLSSPIDISGPSGNQNFTFPFLPSYLEVITDNSRTFVGDFTLTYDTTAPGIRAFGQVIQSVNIRIDNADDAPIWSVNPSDQNIADGQPFSFPFSGTVTDASTFNPTPTADLTYSLNLITGTCTFIGIDPVTGVISGTVPLTAPATCNFTLAATDSNGLVGSSAVVSYSVENLNTKAVAVGSIPTQVATENQEFELDLLPYFSDIDFENSDEQELLTFSCANCDALNIEGLEITSSGQLTWTPPYTSDAVYPAIEIHLSDREMSQEIPVDFVTQTFDLSVIPSAAPVVLSFSDTDFEMNEGASLSASFDVQAFSTDPIDQYDYNVIVECFSCRQGLTSLAANGRSGNSASSKIIDIEFNSDFTDGNSSAGSFRAWALRATVVKSDDSSVVATQNLSLRVSNVNQLPTALGANGDTAPGRFDFVIDLGNPLNRFNEFAISFQLVDADGAFDSYSYQFEDVENLPPFGNLNTSTGSWAFTPILCQPGGGQTAQKSFRVSGADSSGTKISRQVTIEILDTTNSPICP